MNFSNLYGHFYCAEQKLISMRDENSFFSIFFYSRFNREASTYVESKAHNFHGSSTMDVFLFTIFFKHPNAISRAFEPVHTHSAAEYEAGPLLFSAQ
jgi:hypothetical protein